MKLSIIGIEGQKESDFEEFEDIGFTIDYHKKGVQASAEIVEFIKSIVLSFPQEFTTTILVNSANLLLLKTKDAILNLWRKNILNKKAYKITTQSRKEFKVELEIRLRVGEETRDLCL